MKLNLNAWALACVLLGLVAFSGCDKKDKTKADGSQIEPAKIKKKTALKPANNPKDGIASNASIQNLPSPVGYVFDKPFRIKAGNEFVSVESPGYACPTMADVDGDGKQDLVVGQFNNGNMQFCKNVAADGEMPKFAKPQWLKSGDVRATVPGVW